MEDTRWEKKLFADLNQLPSRNRLVSWLAASRREGIRYESRNQDAYFEVCAYMIGFPGLVAKDMEIDL